MPNRIHELNVRIVALGEVAAAGGRIKTSDLIAKLTTKFSPAGEDAEILRNRSDTKFSQIVRNLVSHKDSGTSIFANGYATHDAEDKAIVITDAGREFLAGLNQSPE